MKSFQFSVQSLPGGIARFYDRDTGNLLRVETTPEGGALIRAAKDNFTRTQRRGFVRYLKLEGFIPDAQAIWVVDASWPYAEPGFNPYTRRQGWRLLLGLTLGWSLFMCWVVFR